MNLNKAMLIGNLTKNPELKNLPSGQAVASFGVATNMSWTDQSGQKQTKAEFHNIVVWRKLAEVCAQYLHKGSKVYIEGRLQTTSWDGQDGVKKYRTEIVADNMIMLDGKNDGEQRTDVAQSDNSNNTNFEDPNWKEPADTDEVKIDDIPF